MSTFLAMGLVWTKFLIAESMVLWECGSSDLSVAIISSKIGKKFDKILFSGFVNVNFCFSIIFCAVNSKDSKWVEYHKAWSSYKRSIQLELLSKLKTTDR